MTDKSPAGDLRSTRSDIVARLDARFGARPEARRTMTALAVDNVPMVCGHSTHAGRPQTTVSSQMLASAGIRTHH